MNERWVDVSHEALIRGWPRLRGWIEEDRAGLRMHRRLTEAAQEWDRIRDESALYRGARLSQAVEWRERHAPSLNELERTFLDESVAVEQREVRLRERRRRRVIVWLSASLVVFSVLAAVAVLQWRQAYRQGQIALARQLGAQATLLGERREVRFRFRRLLLATEEMKRLAAVGVESLEVDLAIRRELALLLPHRLRVNVEYLHDHVLLSPDGRHLIAGDLDSKNVGVWDIATGTQLVRFDDEAGGAFTANFAGKTVRFQMAGGMGRRHIPALSGDGKYVVTEADGSGSVAQVWETETGKELLRLEDRYGSHEYALSAGGRYLAVSTSIYDSATSTYSEPTTLVWDVRAKRQVGGDAPGTVRALSEDGTLLVTSWGMWEVIPELKEVCRWERKTFDAVLANDGGHVAIWTEQGGQKEIQVWSRALRKMTASVPTPEWDGVLRAVTPDGRFVLLARDRSGADTTGRDVQVLDTATKAIIESYDELAAGPAIVDQSGRYLMASVLFQDERERTTAIDVWELRKEGGALLRVSPAGPLIDVGIGRSGRLTIISRKSDKLAIARWDIATGREDAGRRAEVTGQSASFAADGETFAVIGSAGVEVRTTGEAGAIATFAAPGVTRVMWSPDGRHLAAQAGRQVRVWEIQSRQSAGGFTLPERASASALGRDGASVAGVMTIGREGTRPPESQHRAAWKVADGKEMENSDPDLGLPDGRYRHMAAPGAPMLILADRQTGKEAFRIPTDEPLIALDHEGTYLATRSGNHVHVWALRQSDVIAQACRRLSRNLTLEEWREYVGDEPYRKTCAELP